MKRLVICCDGTWNRPDNQHVTNIEKIARTVETDPAKTGGTHQLVLYLSGVGGGYHVDRLLGGAFGFGLFTHVVTGYRFLAAHFEPGDEIYIFGFSRGAYTARSLAGMIGRVGLLTRRALVADKLPEAVARYRRDAPRGGAEGQSQAEFARDYCHEATPIHFLGVFDTVGALGVPGAIKRAHQFHDVQLGSGVRLARHAVAADERRMKFEPCLWEAGSGESEDPRVVQAWFAGAHSDIGGGYPETGLSDSALLWMVAEASQAGLAFHEEYLGAYLGCGSSAIRHESMTWFYRLLNLFIALRIRLGLRDGVAFLGHSRRLLRPDCLSVRVAEPAADHFRAAEGYHFHPMAELVALAGELSAIVEPAIGLPERSYAEVLERLALRGVSLGAGGSSARGEGSEDGGSAGPAP